ncbi:MAG: Rpn family recombination-promoting nuclease/putative transposase [Endomicrobium sp.]|jgi:predicted transposase/invertase (TIGR01784 family)|nr:Rpn family recombination-promoting nuclease/putative transposase [Endomicrobium sp.]
MKQNQEERLNPLNDYMFQKCMGEKGDEEQLLDFLNAVLGYSGDYKLSSVEILENKTFLADTLGKKACILDVRAVVADGTKVNIEVQLNTFKDMDKRILFYWSKEFVETLDSGEQYRQLPKVIVINILDFNLIPTEKIKEYHTSFHIREDKHTEYKLTDILEIHCIEMLKFHQLENKNKENPLHKWLIMFDWRTNMEMINEITQKDAAAKSFQEKFNAVSRDPQEMRLYFLREMARLDYNSGIDDARTEGRREGMIEGEQKRNIEIAKKMKSQGISVEQINQWTGLSNKEIEKI